MILIVCALRAELRGWQPRPGTELLESGVGPVEAAASTALALGRATYSAVVNAGLAGAFSGRAQIGEAVLVAEEYLADIGLEDGSRLTLPDGASLIDRAFSSDELLARVERLPYRVASGLTVHRVTGTDATRDRLEQRYAADVESMEGFAVLRASQRAGVPALEIRGISNYVGPRQSSRWNFSAGSQACIAALEAVLDALTLETVR